MRARPDLWLPERSGFEPIDAASAPTGDGGLRDPRERPAGHAATGRRDAAVGRPRRYRVLRVGLGDDDVPERTVLVRCCGRPADTAESTTGSASSVTPSKDPSRIRTCSPTPRRRSSPSPRWSRPEPIPGRHGSTTPSPVTSIGRSQLASRAEPSPRKRRRDDGSGGVLTVFVAARAGGCHRRRRSNAASDGNGRQLPTSKLVGLSVGLPNFALPTRKLHAPDVLIKGLSQVASVSGVGGIRSASPDSGAG